MSFILDALRKSDQQRQRSGAPTLMTAQVPLAQPKPFLWWWYGILAAVLIGAGILIGWMQQWQAEPAVSAIPSDAGRPLQSSAQKFTPAPLPAMPETSGKQDLQQPLREPTMVTQTPPLPVVAPRDMPLKPATQSPQSVVVAIRPRVTTAPAPEQQAAPGPGEAPSAAAAITLAELPPALQQEIPKLAILAHSYSSRPKERFVFINDQMWREAEYPWPGLKLEQITPEGMVFSYKGYRFRRGTNP
ncbi:MAG: general secretion pathway protein GspB [Pseudomonadota bacterium]